MEEENIYPIFDRMLSRKEMCIRDRPMTYGALFVAILVLLYILHYLVTGEFTF